MMKLIRVKVKNFRSVMDSGWIDCDDVTSLVGINEAGKSNLILALWKLNPARDEDDAKIDMLHDMPAKEYSSWRNKPSEIDFITAEFEIEDELTAQIAELSGCEQASLTSVHITRYFDGEYKIGFPNLTVSGTEIKRIAESSKEKASGEDEASPLENDAVKDSILVGMPKFVYYSNYGNLDAQIYLPHTVKLLKGEKIPGFDNQAKVRTLRVLFDFVSLQPQEVLELGKDPAVLVRQANGTETRREPTVEEIEKATKQKEERTTLLNSASTKLTREFKNWWKQGNYTFRLQADGDFFKIWVSDDKRPEEIELERRSTGLQWFLSFFLIFLVESEEAHKGAILLLDEAGLTLHPMAQKDLVAFFENLSQTNQIVHTTHSPFLVDTTNIDRVKVVYSDNNGYTVASSDLRAADDKINEKSIYAVHAALGLSVSDILLQGCQPVIVEGTSDQYYMNAIKQFLIRSGKLTPNQELVFMPSGGCTSKAVKAIASLVSGRSGELPFIILDSDKTANSAKQQLLSELYKETDGKIISVAEIAGFDNSEVEDLIPLSLMKRHIDRIFNNVEEETFDSVCNSNKPIIPQIESFATKHNVILERGWKVSLAKGVKAQLSNPKTTVDEGVMSNWETLFSKIST